MGIETKSLELLNELLQMSEDSIKTIKQQTVDLRKEDQYIIAPPEDLLKISNTIQKINQAKKEIDVMLRTVKRE